MNATLVCDTCARIMFLKRKKVTHSYVEISPRKNAQLFVFRFMYIAKILKSVMHYEAENVKWEPNFLDGYPVNSRVLTASEFHGCFFPQLCPCYHGNNWNLVGATCRYLCYVPRGRPPEERQLMCCICMGCCDKNRGELLARSKSADYQGCIHGQQDKCSLPC